MKLKSTNAAIVSGFVLTAAAMFTLGWGGAAISAETAAAPGALVHIADPNLTKLINLSLRFPEDHTLKQDDLRKLTMLGAFEPRTMRRERELISQIRTLDGLQNARWQNISFVDLPGASKLISIAGLSNEDHIIGADFSGGAHTSPLRNIQALNGKFNLSAVDISNTSVSSVKGLTDGGARSLTSFQARGDKALTSLDGIEWAGGWELSQQKDSLLDISDTNAAGLRAVLVGWSPGQLLISGDTRVTAKDLAPITAAGADGYTANVVLTADTSQLAVSHSARFA
jgi:hypothetical protein